MTNLKTIQAIIEEANPGVRYTYVLASSVNVGGTLVLAIQARVAQHRGFMGEVNASLRPDIRYIEAADYAVLSQGKGDFGAVKQRKQLFQDVLL